MSRGGKVSAGLGLAMLAFGALLYWLFYDNPRPEGAFALTLDALRAEATRLPGPRPARIEAEIVSHTPVPRIAIVAGTSWADVDMVRASYRIVWPDRSIVIDTANDERAARQFKAARFDRGAYARVIQAMDAASAIVVTHEHPDHIGGLVTSPHLASQLPKALLTPEQFGAGARMAPLSWPAGSSRRVRPLVYGRIHAIAPGVVLIKTPGHTPGSQMVYVRRADGREFIFMGDTASLADNIVLQRMRSRYVTDFYGDTHDDRDAVMRQIRALHAAQESDPALVLVPGHDAAAILRFEHEGSLVPGFHFGR